MVIEHSKKGENSVLKEYGPNHGLNNVDLYNFATKVLEPICENHFVYSGIKAKVTTKASKPVRGKDLHRAAFKVTATSLQDGSKETFSVLCKIYSNDSVHDSVTIDYTAVMNGYYKYIATIIAGTVYYLRMDDIYRYQAEMGNSCISRDAKFIFVDAQYFIDNAQYFVQVNEESMEQYNKGYERYIG